MLHPAVSSGRAAAYLYACICAPSRARITSDEIAQAVRINATQVRRDLSQLLGKSGKRGVGYRPSELARGLRSLTGGFGAGSGGVVLIAAERDRQLHGTQAATDSSELGLMIRAGARIAEEIDELLAARAA